MSFTRAGVRFLGARTSQPLRMAFRRRVATQAAPEAPAVDSRSGFQKFMDSPVGPKTVHFWAPVFKWGLVIAGISDFARPASQLSLTQNLALMATGAIWTRWCFIIKPQNLALAAVNFFLFCVGGVQVSRVVLYQNSVKEPLKEEAKNAEGVVKDSIDTTKKVVGAA